MNDNSMNELKFDLSDCTNKTKSLSMCLIEQISENADLV